MHIKYRPEIDGLRAISILSIIIYHYNKISIPGIFELKGGFLGVDIFFVISGYLITLIIFTELRATNSFSFINFYQRRIRRIIPALFFVVLICLPFSWFFLLPYSFVDFTKSILSILSFSSNYYFWYTQTQYAAEAAMLKPLLHTWSLAVEEQYYIFAPLLLVLIYRYLKKYFLFILLFGFVISLITANYLAYNNPNINFYNLISRAFELLSGSIIAYMKIFYPKNFFNKKFNTIFSFFGLSLIFIAIFLFDDDMHLPSFFTLIPIVGASMFIHFSSEDGKITKIMSNKFLVFTGLISYSLYLWHFPIFSFAEILDIDTDNLLNGILIWIALILSSIGSYYFIEKPFRNKKNMSIKRLYKYMVPSLILISSFSIIVIYNDGFKNRVPEIFHKNIFYERSKKIEICLNRFEKKEGCELNSKSSKSVFLIGDSHMSDLYNFGLKKILLDRNYRINTFACFVYPGFDLIFYKTNKIYEKCSSKNFLLIEKKLIKTKNPIVIIFGRMPLHLSGEYFNNQEGGIENNLKLSETAYKTNLKNFTLEKSFTKFINNLLEINAKVIFIYPYPEAGWHVPKKIMSKIPKKTYEINNFLVPENFVTTSYDVYIKRTIKSFKLLNSIQHKNIYRIYPHKFLCNNIVKKRCINHDEKEIYYRDDDHPSAKGAEMINSLIIKKLNLIENLK